MTDDVANRYREALQQGHVAVVKGRPREAIGHYQEAARLADDRPLPFVSMASVYLQMRRPKEAITAYDEALRRAPNDVVAMRGMASALEADGRVAESSVVARRAAELEAMDRAGHRGGARVDEQRRQLEQHIVNGSLARAAGDLDRAAAAFHAAALGYAARDEFAAALDACLRALEARPGAIDVHFTMAHLYLRRGWAELGVQRVLLIDRRLHIDSDARRHAALRALARDFRSLAPELQQLAAASV
jgi:tetratricopeptide (TPR) repeat protein